MAPMRAREHPHEIRRHSNVNTIDSNNDSDDDDPHVRPQAVPVHPLQSMQGPFEESMLDATGESQVVPFQCNPNVTVELRKDILCKDGNAAELDWNFSYNCHWRHHPRGNYHPLAKTLSQITFGLHLLHQHLEKSVADVAEILLKHVNELDGFLQRASEDMDSSLKDMLFRRNCLKVPMEHVSEFDRLLDDRSYRAQLLDGNVTIDRTITRMSQLLHDYLIDMATFRDANNELDHYLGQIGEEWAENNEDVARIYAAMCGNTAGWAQFVQSLIAKTEKLGVVLVQVGSYCNEIEKRCGAASRRSLVASRASSRTSSTHEHSRSLHQVLDNKPLPSTPNKTTPLITLSSPTKNPIPPDDDMTNIEVRPAGKRGPFADDSSTESLEQHQHTAELSASVKNTAPPSPNKILEKRESMGKANHSQKPSVSSGHSEVGTVADETASMRAARKTREAEEELIGPRMPVLKGKMDTAHLGSPPLTAKDSAHSSVSVTSRPQPRGNLKLYPASSPHTPLYTPRFGSALDLPSLTRPTSPLRTQSALEHRGGASFRLSKRPSLTGIKRFFSRKKGRIGDTIYE